MQRASHRITAFYPLHVAPIFIVKMNTVSHAIKRFGVRRAPRWL